MNTETPQREIRSIVLFTLESFASSAAVAWLVENYPDAIPLVVVSRRFGGKYGSLLHQTRKNLRQSGWQFVLYTTLNIVVFKPFVYIFDIVNSLLGRTKKQSTLRQLCKRHNIQLLYTREVKASDVVETIKFHKPDLGLVAYFDHVISQEIIDIPTYGILNIHSALLPFYRGPFPALWPVVLGEQKGGVTIHFINNQLDEGEILFQQSIDYMESESILNMEARFILIGMRYIPKVIEGIIHNTLTKEPQNQGNYYGFPTKRDLMKLDNAPHKLVSLGQYMRSF